MDPSRWIYFVPYEDDPEEAFRKLQAQELKAGRFYFPNHDSKGEEVFDPLFWPTPAPETFEEALELADAIDANLPYRSREHDPHVPKSRAEAHRLSPAGTRSILDMDGIALPGKDAWRHITVLSADQLTKRFLTTRPAYEDLVERESELFERLNRGEGVVFIVFENDEPIRLCFAGLILD